MCSSFLGILPIKSSSAVSYPVDAQVLNDWKFSRLKEFKYREVGAENEPFDLYMQNVGLLEESNVIAEAKSDDAEVSMAPIKEDGSSAEEHSVYSSPNWGFSGCLGQELAALLVHLEVRSADLDLLYMFFTFLLNFMSKRVIVQFVWPEIWSSQAVLPSSGQC
ncbi:hypothetical protein LIER_38911 [Lithospermum erythrorhizon]|uniref:Uncharacterized protein n=1 Tax=Lithospermum erythrorhizon TaxID=34254 RepID=A0AAV3Q8E2_LITER